MGEITMNRNKLLLLAVAVLLFLVCVVACSGEPADGKEWPKTPTETPETPDTPDTPDKPGEGGGTGTKPDKPVDPDKPSKPETVVVNFDDGCGNIQPVEVSRGSAVSKPNDPECTKTGPHMFGGWFIGDELYDFSKPVTDEITLVAKWIQYNTITDASGLVGAFASGGTFVIGSDIEMTFEDSEDFHVSQNLVLYLNGRTVTFKDGLHVSGCSLTINEDSNGKGELAFQDSYSAQIYVENEGCLVVNGGRIASYIDENVWLIQVDDGSLELNGGEIYTVACNGIDVMPVVGETANVVINDVKIDALSNAVSISGESTVTINGGTFVSRDDFAIEVYSSYDDGKWKTGPFDIAIKGGTYKANGSNGYAAAGLLVAGNGNVTVDGGRFEVTDGVGILVGSGEVFVNHVDDISLTLVSGSKEAKSPDTGDKIPLAPIVSEVNPYYYCGTPVVHNKTTYEHVKVLSSPSA